MATTKVYTFTFASGATGTNKQYVGPNSLVNLVLSNVTGWNAAAGNASVTIRAGLSATDTHSDIKSNTISTEVVKGMYPMPYAGFHYLSVGFGTAVTGSAANTVDVIVFDPI